MALLEDGDALTGRWRLTSAKWKVLGAVALNQAPLTAPGIARAMGLTRQGAQKQLDALLADKLVMREPNSADARAPLYQLTAKGARIYQEIRLAWQARSEQLVRKLNKAELLAAANTLGTLSAAIFSTPHSRKS